jgi:bacteriocin-like protein
MNTSNINQGEASMRELTDEEMENVSGGILFIVAIWAYNHGGEQMYTDSSLPAGTWG